jgi:hypothetical protein
MSPSLRAQVYPVEVSSGRWLDHHTLADGKETWWTEAGIHVVYPEAKIGPMKDHRKKRSRFLGGRTIRAMRLVPPQPLGFGREHIWVYLKDDVIALVEGDSGSAVGALRDKENRPLLTNAQLMAKYGVSGAFTRYWKKKRSRLRPGEPALRSEPIANVFEPVGGPAIVPGYFEEDAQRILRGEESNPRKLGAGRRAHPCPGRADDDESKAVLKEILANGPVLRSDVLSRAFKAGVSWKRLYRAAAALGVVRRRSASGGNRQKGYWCLPKQPLPDSSPSGRSAAPYADVVSLLHALLASGPLSSQEVICRARQAGVSRGRLYRAMESGADILTGRLPGGWGYWYLPGQPLPSLEDLRESMARVEAEAAPAGPGHPNAGRSEEPPPDSVAGEPTGAPRRRGRRPGMTEKVRNRDWSMIQDWRTGAFRHVTDLATKYRVDPSYARKVLKKAGEKGPEK